jgi:5'-phosphate synthase pdxT subunit
MKIGVLALQGAVSEHIKIVENLNVEAVPVRLPSNLNGLDALILPGGESTTISKLLSDYNLLEPLRQRIHEGFPVFGTCAGTILLAHSVSDSTVITLDAMDIVVDRNAYGRQIDSFETDLRVQALGEGLFHGIFIRAPVIQQVGTDVEVLCRYNGHVVAVRQGNVLACTFHPELTEDTRFHSYFRDIIRGDRGAESNN